MGILEVEGEAVDTIVKQCQKAFESHDLLEIYTALLIMTADVLVQLGNGSMESSLKQAAVTPTNLIEYMYFIKEQRREASKGLDS